MFFQVQRYPSHKTTVPTAAGLLLCWSLLTSGQGERETGVTPEGCHHELSLEKSQRVQWVDIKERRAAPGDNHGS